MKFHFCWDTDCPDWLLAEIYTLSSLSSVKLRMLVAHIAAAIIGQPLDAEKLTKWTGEEDTSKAEACAGGIRWILEKAAGAQVPGSILDSELQQLGFPKEHATALVKVYTEQQAALYNKLRQSNGINCWGGEVDFDVDVKGVEVAGSVEPVLKLTMVKHLQRSCDGNPDQFEMCITRDQLKVLLHELCEARRIMESLT